MITDMYTIDSADSKTTALNGLVEAGRFYGMTPDATDRLRALGSALLEVAEGLDKVEKTQLWMETSPEEAVVHLKADCVVDLTEEDALKKLSTTGKNTERKGIFAKIRGAFEEMAIADNEELNTLGYVPGMEYDVYPVLWTFAPGFHASENHWDGRAAADLHRLADSMDVGFSSEQVEIAAHIKTAK